MKRDLNQLCNNVFDIVIIGGGIYGVCAAWDAALRGLSVALVEKGDFGCATSSNSLKIIHGGLRYLQHADFKRMRESIHERMVLMRIAPHLVHPLPCIMPTYGHAMKGREIMALAMFMNDFVGFDRNGLQDPQKYLPAGRVISREECLHLIPGVDDKGLTGGAIWYDCQVYNSERLLFSFLHSATQSGAQAANYVEATGFLLQHDRVTGIKAREVLTQTDLEIRGRLVINNSGPWMNNVLGLMDGRASDKRVLLSKAMNLVIRRQLILEYAAGVPSKYEFKDADAVINKGSRLLFVTPWRQYSLVGTTHVAYDGDPRDFHISEQDIQTFVKELDEAYPAAGLKRDDVSFFYGGLLPMDSVNPRTGDVRLVKHYIVRDHKAEHGIDGLLTVVGVKYTTARDVAQKTIDLAMRKLDRGFRKSIGQTTPIHGGQIERFSDYLKRETEQPPFDLPSKLVEHLVRNYGSAYHEVLAVSKDDRKSFDRLSGNTEVIRAEVLHAIKHEMAVKLADVVMRRTELGTAGYPGDEALNNCAAIMAAELGWNKRQTQEEIAATKAIFRPAT